MQQSHRRRTSENRNEDNHFYLKLSTPSPTAGTSHQPDSFPIHPTRVQNKRVNTQPVMTSRVVPYPRHYVTELSGPESDDSAMRSLPTMPLIATKRMYTRKLKTMMTSMTILNLLNCKLDLRMLISVITTVPWFQ